MFLNRAVAYDPILPYSTLFESTFYFWIVWNESPKDYNVSEQGGSISRSLDNDNCLKKIEREKKKKKKRKKKKKKNTH